MHFCERLLYTCIILWGRRLRVQGVQGGREALPAYSLHFWILNHVTAVSAQKEIR